MKIAFLHTMDSNESVFGSAAIKAGWSSDHMHHVIREDLRQAMGQQLSSETIAHGLVHDALRELAVNADAIIVTCATLGPAVDTIVTSAVPIIRADTALAKAASHSGKNIVVLCAVESTVAPNKTLFERYAANTDARVTVQLIPNAWMLYQEGKQAECMEVCAQAASEAFNQGFDVVAYAHPWMAGADELTGNTFRPMHGVQASLDALRSVLPAK